MGKEDSYVLRGKLVAKPRSGTSYAKTRQIIAEKLLGFEVNDKHEKLFDRIGSVKLEDDKIEITLKMNKHVFGMGARDELKRQLKICDLLSGLESSFGIGGGTPDEATDKRLKEMEEQGVIMVSHWTDLEEKDFDS
jgi:hypothetical protein